MVLLLSGPGALFSLSFLGFFLSLVSGAIVNRTIDDTFGDSSTGQLVTYAPSTGGVWKGKDCTNCFINPDISRAFDETYTAATYVPSLGSMSITMQFTGTAIYVFFILANNAGNGVTTSTVVNFSLDGNSPQVYQHSPDLTTTDINFNQLVYSQTNLKNTQHILVLSTSGDHDIYVNFDYAIYTHDDGVTPTPLPATGSSTPSPSPSPSSSSPVSTSVSVTSLSSTSASKSSSTTSLAAGITASATSNSVSSSSTSVSGQDSASSNKKSSPIGAIVGGVVGGIAVAAILIFFLLWRIRRREGNLEDTRAVENGEKVALYTQRRTPPPLGSVDPFVPANRSVSTPRSNFQPGGNVQGHSRNDSENTAASPSLDTAYAYDGIAASNDGRQRTRDSAASSSVLAYYGNSSRGGLRSVTGGDHLSSPTTEITIPTPTLPTQHADNSDNVDDVRRARQQELNQRLRTVQEEMAFLASDITGQKTSLQPVRRRRTITRPGTQGTDGVATGEVEESEMSMSEMREQLQMLRDQVLYLQEQQRSDWAQGLSNDPPPGYSSSNPPINPSAPVPAQ